MDTRQLTTRRILLLAAAVVFAAATVLYSVAWMYYVRLQAGVELGIDTTQTPTGYVIDRVYPASPAEAAGLKPKDLIVAVNGKPTAGSNVITEAWLQGHPGDQVALTIQRAGEPQPLTIHASFRQVKNAGPDVSWPVAVAQQIKGSFPILFLIVGMVVLFLRPQDRNAWLLALLFAGIIAASDVPGTIVAAPLSLQPFLKLYRTVFNTFLAGFFYFFFAVFPSPSPLDRRAPWLKWLKWLLLVALAVFGLGGVAVAAPRPLPPLAALLSPAARLQIHQVLTYATIALGFVSLLSNAAVTHGTEDWRKLKVLFWGTLVGIMPVVLVRAAVDLAHLGIPFWLDFFAVLLAFLFPLSFAYAVVKHRVLDIPVLLKRSARYFIVERGFIALLLVLAVLATILLADAFSARFSAGAKVAIPVGATFGVLLISAGTEVHRRVRKRLDRAFFRSAYDAQQILEQLADRTLSVSNRQDLAALLEHYISDALHPQAFLVYLRTAEGRMRASGDNGSALEITPNPMLLMFLESDRPIDLELDVSGQDFLHVPRAECLVPIRGSDGSDLQGLAVLGPRLSEEPYSSGDKRLLASVATQAGIAMRSIALAEKMAERMEAERRTAQEMEIARQVQAKLLPQQAPVLATLECAGKCLQTRAVGGDYYDFLELGSGRIGLVLADISGKGISAALLMANLQANLRSQYALALEDIPRLLRSVNLLFYRNTEANHYATAFFGVYDDASRALRYVNCGHNAPLLLRASGTVEHLDSTSTVLGLFEQWDCSATETELAAGDVLVIFTDGVTESTGNNCEEYGEERLLEVVRRHGSAHANALLERIVADVKGFSVGEQADDLTLVVARAI